MTVSAISASKESRCKKVNAQQAILEMFIWWYELCVWKWIEMNGNEINWLIDEWLMDSSVMINDMWMRKGLRYDR